MLKVNETKAPVHNSSIEDEPSISIDDLRAIASIILLHIPHIVLPAILFSIIAAGYVMMRAPVYTAHTNLLMLNSKLAFSPDEAIYAESQLDPTFLETQIEILRSDKIALDVVDRLKLSATAEKPEQEGMLTSILSWLTPQAKPEGEADADKLSAEDARQAALFALRGSLHVERIGLSYIVDVGFSASDPEEAARITNEIAKAYIDDQNAARSDAAQSASPWIRDRVQALGPRTRIVARASPPKFKSNARGMLIVLGGGIMGLSLGLAGVLAKEFFRGTIRTPEQAAGASASECFGLLPRLSAQADTVGATTVRGQQTTGRRPKDDTWLLSYVVDHPLSAFWHTLRRVNVAIDIRHGASRSVCAVGVTSTFPGEGKTTVAANLAQLIAHLGRRVLLVDLNPYNPTLSRRFGEGKAPGLLNIVTAASLDGLTVSDPRTGLDLLPIDYRDQLDPPSSFVSPEALEGLLNQAGDRYDYVIFDLPSLSPTFDVRAAAEALNHILVVVDWEKVMPDHLKLGLSLAGSAREKIVGTVLNRVRVAKFRRVFSTLGTFWGPQKMSMRARAYGRANGIIEPFARRVAELGGARFKMRGLNAGAPSVAIRERIAGTVLNKVRVAKFRRAFSTLGAFWGPQATSLRRRRVGRWALGIREPFARRVAKLGIARSTIRGLNVGAPSITTPDPDTAQRLTI